MVDQPRTLDDNFYFVSFSHYTCTWLTHWDSNSICIFVCQWVFYLTGCIPTEITMVFISVGTPTGFSPTGFSKSNCHCN